MSENMYNMYEDMYNAGNIKDLCYTPILNKLTFRNINRLVIGHLNINSLPSKFGQVNLAKLTIAENFDILAITETKIDSSFPCSQVIIEGFSIPSRFDTNRLHGGAIVYVRDDIPSKQLI